MKLENTTAIFAQDGENIGSSNFEQVFPKDGHVVVCILLAKFKSVTGRSMAYNHLSLFAGFGR
ncbi:MAG TPA: hypothetical protein VGM52_17865 [Herbaspirillum sp.]|jgi:hypothetical protein